MKKLKAHFVVTLAVSFIQFWLFAAGTKLSNFSVFIGALFVLGHHTSWTANFIFNLCVTAVAAAGFILTIRDQERRKQGMDTFVSHAPSTR